MCSIVPNNRDSLVINKPHGTTNCFNKSMHIGVIEWGTYLRS